MGGDRWERERRELVSLLEGAGYIRRPEVRAAFLQVPRERFVPEDLRTSAYEDVPLPIGYGQTISAPSMIAIMLEEAALTRGEKVLEVGTGSGYTTALLAEITGPESVVSIERLRELEPFGRENLHAAGYEVRVLIGDGTLGFPQEAPYDCILATAGAPNIPKAWKEQTKVGGRIVAPVGRSRLSQVLVTARRVGPEKWEIMEGTPCAFVPLVGEQGWRRE